MANILVVDDEKSIRLTLKAFLEKDGHDVMQAEDAQCALDILKTNTMDVVVSDIILPRVTGISLLHEVRELVPGVEVIMMTGEPTVETASEAVRAGAFDYLFKPISREMICRTVNNAARMRALYAEREQLSEANRQYREELERLVAERTEELERALLELRQQQVQVVQQERLRALGEMASGIAHDFNNSLSVIMGFAELMKQNPRLAENREKLDHYLELVLTAARDGAAVVNRLREFYRPREQDEGFTPIDITLVVREAVELTTPRWQAQSQARGIGVQIIDQMQDVSPILGDAAELREVLTNLIINAVDAMAADGAITLSSSEESGLVSISVRDTGSGMSEDVKRRCLEPFFTTKENHGTGLGLSVTYGIVTRHGGTVSLESELGKGTCITLGFPKAQHPHAEEAQPVLLAVAQPLQILVVDDVIQIRELLAELLEATGHRVTMAESGSQALGVYRPDKFDLVILDRAMPGMSGDELAKNLKERTPALPIIMLTGFGNMMNNVDERPSCVDLVVGKPLQVEELELAIRSLNIQPMDHPATLADKLSQG